MKENNTGTSALPPAPHRPVSALQCYLAYATALAAGYAAWVILQRPAFSWNPLWAVLAASCVSTMVIWVFSIANNNSSIYDPYWVIARPFLVLALKSFGDGRMFGPWGLRQVIILSLFVMWASRYHLFYAWSGWRSGLVHEDWRYEKMRSAPVPYWLNSLIGMHLFPTVLVYFALVPAAMVVISESAAAQVAARMQIWDVLGVLLALIAVSIEFAADRQLRAYRLSKDYDPRRSFRGGLWKYSRHPNYFGEVLFWLSMIPFAVAGGFLAAFPVLVIAGPIAMAAFFRFSSWLMDMRSLERRTDYSQVMLETSAMVPWWPRRADRSTRGATAR